MNKQWIKENLRPGEEWAGIIRGQNGERDYHLVAMNGELGNANWYQAMEYAKSLGGDLPNRREARLLEINAPAVFDKSGWYWTSTQSANISVSAWIQDFSDGYQYTSHKSNESRARAIRRIYIEE